MTPKRSGKLIVLEGMDRVGKGTLISALKKYEEGRGKTILNLDPYQEANLLNPSVSEVNSHDVILTSEPSYNGIGRIIRKEMIAKEDARVSLDLFLKEYRKLNNYIIQAMMPLVRNYPLSELQDIYALSIKIGMVARAETERKYSALETAKAYALDRSVLFKTAILPYLDEGKTIIQSRGVASSLVYQPVQAEMKNENLTLEDVLSLSGNQFELAHAPDLLIILSVNDVEKAFARSEKRGKDDKSEFEKIEFQKKLKPRYESQWLRALFDERGTIVKYVDTSGSEQESVNNVLTAYQDFLKVAS